MKTISNSIQQAELEREKEERERREAAIRDAVNNSIMKASNEELKAASWNAPSGLLDRIL